MATPMTADQFVAALRAEGLTVVELPGWRTNNRSSAGPFGPVLGTVTHHTGSDIDNRAAYDYANGVLFMGYKALPGPLCQSGLGPDGTVYMVGNGRCNHAGGGDPNVLAAVAADAVPLDREMKPQYGNANGVDGNTRLYGLEVMRSGSLPTPPVQYVASVRWNVAVLRSHGWTAQSAIGHKEWSKDKPDPGLVDMAAFRRDIASALALPPGVWGTPSQEDDMPFTPDQLEQIVRKAIATTVIETLPDENGKTYQVPLPQILQWIQADAHKAAAPPPAAK